ncbi:MULTISPECIES: MraY family glycosyltransferase [Pseudomonas]|uniref:MraY family glycosyltransferase n=1 Tax=Pseudomonas TaxID=286 RepID=UPI0023626CFD|nr:MULTISPECIES: glycosyltransferase family 4 protein [Pseudomonas]WJV24873.1 glycosyltransferase family 4 protein [Pseudomonas chlororaphis]
MSYWWILSIIAIGASFCLTALLRYYSLSRNIMDIPNERSSHSIPTPRGGGVSIVMTFLGSLVVMRCLGWIDLPFFLAVAGSGLLVAIVGFMDDHGHVAARWRLLGHFGGALWALFWLGGMPTIEIGGVGFDWRWVGGFVASVYLVWILNLYNFMDGIDGIASVEAICVCLGSCVLYLVSGNQSLVWAPLMLASAVSGFLIWNFPPARIFMGDAGSGFLGIVLGVFSIQAGHVEPRLFWVWIILLGVFIVDATLTLLCRLARGDRVYKAHRSHAYQYASRLYGRHFPVTIAVVVINLFWLFPMALSVVYFDVDGALALFVAYVPLVLIAIRYRAGRPEVRSPNIQS